MLHYALNMLNIYEQSITSGIVNRKLLAIFQRVLYQIQMNQSKVSNLKKYSINCAFMIEMINNSFYESESNFRLIKRESSNRKKNYGR